MNLKHRIPPPLVLVATLVLMRLVSWFDPYAGSQWPYSVQVGLALVILGCLCAAGGVMSFAKAHTTIDPLRPQKASHLVTSGVFAFTRNPMYLGMALLALGGATYLQSPLAFICVAAFVAYIQHFQIRPEEEAMQELFGEAFSEYRLRVRRWGIL